MSDVDKKKPSIWWVILTMLATSPICLIFLYFGEPGLSFERLALSLSIGKFRSKVGSPHQASARHAEAVKIRSCQGINIKAEVLFDLYAIYCELQQAEAFAGVTEACAWIKVDAQFLVGLDEPKVIEAGGVRERHAWRDLCHRMFARRKGPYSQEFSSECEP